MTWIQILLVIAILVLYILYLRFFKHQLISRVVLFMLFCGGIIAILFPEMTNKLANLVGVGRGADLLTYMLVVIFYASFYYLYKKIDAIEARQIKIIRELALKKAK